MYGIEPWTPLFYYILKWGKCFYFRIGYNNANINDMHHHLDTEEKVQGPWSLKPGVHRQQWSE
jgi:hypothetical protein